MNSKSKSDTFTVVSDYVRKLSLLSGVVFCAFTCWVYVWVFDVDFGLKSNGSVAIVQTDQVKESDTQFIGRENHFNTSGDNSAQIQKATVNETPQNNRETLTQAIEIKSENHNSDESIQSSALSVLEYVNSTCNENLVHLSWVTSGPGKGWLEIEHSSDGENFEVLAEKPKVKPGEIGNHIDLFVNPETNNKRYYRLRNKGNNNKYEYSRTVEIACRRAKEKHDVDVFPVGYGAFRIVVNASIDDHFTVSLTDISETEIVTENFEVEKGSNEYEFRSGNIPRGIYNLKVSNGDMVSQKKVTLK